MDGNLKQALARWAEDPATEMVRHPDKYNFQGEPIANVPTAFARDDLEQRTFVTKRDEIRRKFRTVVDDCIITLEDVLPGRAPIEMADRPERLVDRLELSALDEIENAGLMASRLDESPWSDDYWALYTGVLGKRYADESYPNSRDWAVNHDYVLDRPAGAVVASHDAARIDLLSPSEKYDLLVGDSTGGLTRAMWSEGRSYYDRYGQVESWMGICHGWAPAAYMLDRPSHEVTLLAADGATRVRFYPSDIKALASLLWAKVPTVTRFIGSRSNDRDPAIDPESGRNISPQVFDTNPGSWHLSLVNQIGVARRSFVIDATYDYEVWNQPVVGYRYLYFNPQTLTFANSLEAATVPLSSFSRDRFKKWRSNDTTAVLGIGMRLDYVVETRPTHAHVDTPDDDALHSVIYLYDLELDAKNRVIGGEWYKNEHPDFLWTPSATARARTPADSLATGFWDQSKALPASWQRAAQRMSGYGAPLGKIVERLVDLAHD